MATPLFVDIGSHVPVKKVDENLMYAESFSSIPAIGTNMENADHGVPTLSMEAPTATLSAATAPGVISTVVTEDTMVPPVVVKPSATEPTVAPLSAFDQHILVEETTSIAPVVVVLTHVVPLVFVPALESGTMATSISVLEKEIGKVVPCTSSPMLS
ncbi:hypothetical protein V6N13_088725 [Hibiscus sabdariffa]|uniref:Uncharacterized protein n=2 Tax=Hibiscus sabdariffa TaxID=183260 RepID=A0ABR1ZCV8_9ROSI